MKRAEFSRRVKLAAWDRCGGRCEGRVETAAGRPAMRVMTRCNIKLETGRIEYDHNISCELGGDNSLENCVVLCKPCHDAKTHKQDAPAIAKSRAIRARHVGARTSKHPMPGGRRSPWKKKLDGSVVPRNPALRGEGR